MPSDYAEREQPVHHTSDDKIITGDLTSEDALQRLRLRLLDLTGRNRLLNFKHSVGRSLQLAHSNPEAVFSRLYPAGDGSTSLINPVPEPPRTAWTTVNGCLSKLDSKQFAASIGLDNNYEIRESAEDF